MRVGEVRARVVADALMAVTVRKNTLAVGEAGCATRFSRCSELAVVAVVGVFVVVVGSENAAEKEPGSRNAEQKQANKEQEKTELPSLEGSDDDARNVVVTVEGGQGLFGPVLGAVPSPQSLMVLIAVTAAAAAIVIIADIEAATAANRERGRCIGC